MCAVLLGAAVVPSPSRASTTIGADLSQTPVTAIVCAASNCTAMNTALPVGAPPLTSPITGTIFRWRIKTAAGSSGAITFRVIAPSSGGKLTGAGTGDTEWTPTTATTTTFSTRLPVQAGDYVGIDYAVNQDVYAVATSQTGANDAVFQPPLADGGSPASRGNYPNDELLVNADVAALPTSSVSVPACSETGELAATVTSDPGPAVAPKAIHFRIDGGSEQTVATTGKPGSATILVPPGSHTLEYWGEDTVGGLEATHHTASVQVGGCPTTSTATTPTPTTPTTTTPSFSGVSQSHRRWRLGDKLAMFAAGSKAPVGTTFGFTLNVAATVRFAFARMRPGRMVKGKCVAQTARNRTDKACTRSVPIGSRSFNAGPGPHKLFFQGRLTRTKKLKPGTYTLTITATNAAGQRATQTLRPFTIVRG